MSGDEKKLQLDHKMRRKKNITYFSIPVFILSFITIVLSAFYYQKEKTSYITYNETSNVDYKVYLKENDIFEEEYLGKGQAYIASLIDTVVADFSYELKINAKNVNYEYTYGINATVEIIDKDLNEPLFHPTEKLIEDKTLIRNSSNNLQVKEQVTINYDHYNNLAQNIIDKYDLYNTSSNLILTTNISVIGVCEQFESNSRNDYSISLKIPLTKQTISVSMSSTYNSSNNKIRACESYDQSKNIILTFDIIAASLDLLSIVGLVLYILLTRNQIIDYDRKVKSILSQYKSFIQTVTNEFDTRGYSILYVSTIRELLEIRDTLQIPIIMTEDKVNNVSRFHIATEQRLLYIYEIKLDDFRNPKDNLETKKDTKFK